MVLEKTVIMPRASRLILWFGAALALIVVDQATKAWASASLVYGQPNEIFSWLDITLHHNEGAAFSFLSDAGGWQRYFFTGIAVGVSAVICVWMTRLKPEEYWLGWALALVLSGAVGNVIDRILLGYVVDFISVHWQHWYFPTFNIADSCITLGAVGLLVDGFKSPSKS
jgi:signal peptidase II